MTQLTGLTDSADQILQLVQQNLPPITLELVYSGACERWYANVTYGSTTINGIGLCAFPNNLRQWKNAFPFGLQTVVSGDKTDPVYLTDFLSGRASLYYLNAQDVLNLETTVFGNAAVQV